MLRTIFALTFAAAAAFSPVTGGALASNGQFVQSLPGGGATGPGSFKPVDGRGQMSTVNCQSSNQHYQLCTKIKATCDSIKQTAPNHGCGCKKDDDGNLTTCETGV